MRDIMNDPKVSVCMVTYNQERYICQAVESVLVQETNFPVEIVIGEDWSTDGTRSVLEMLARQHPDRIRLLFADRNLGAKRNFMRTFPECRGKYVAILEGDDYWTCPQKLQMQVDALEARPDWAICFHPAQIIYDDWRQAPGLWPANWEKPEATLVDLFNMDFIPTNAVVFRNRLFGDFPPWFSELTMGDWPLHILNASYGNIGFLPEVMSVYRVHAGGFWTSKTREEQLTAVMQLLTAVDHHFGGKYAEPIDQCRMNVVKHVLDEASKAKKALDEIADFRQTHVGLLEENRTLREFHRAWGKSLTYRIARETVRPARQLWKRLRRILSRPSEPQPIAAQPTSSKTLPPPVPYPPARAA